MHRPDWIIARNHRVHLAAVCFRIQRHTHQAAIALLFEDPNAARLEVGDDLRAGHLIRKKNGGRTNSLRIM